MKNTTIFLHHCLNPGTETVTGFRYGVPVEVAHHLLDLCQQGGEIFVEGFNEAYFLFSSSKF
jgi:hypothetical protein